MDKKNMLMPGVDEKFVEERRNNCSRREIIGSNRGYL